MLLPASHVTYTVYYYTDLINNHVCLCLSVIKVTPFDFANVTRKINTTLSPVFAIDRQTAAAENGNAATVTVGIGKFHFYELNCVCEGTQHVSTPYIIVYNYYNACDALHMLMNLCYICTCVLAYG